jgi:uncharacterized membrane protein
MRIHQRTPSSRIHASLSSLFVILAGLFCFCYPFAVIGVAFDVRPPFSLDWAGSFLLFVEGSLLLVAAMLCYGYLRGLCAGLCIIVLSYLVEALGANTGFPFGVYDYTSILLPHLPGYVPLPVMFAWLLIVFGSYGAVKRSALGKRGMSVGTVLTSALLATLLDLAIEPVAAHVVFYWRWVARGALNYYGVPLINFVAWFGVAFVLLLLADWMLRGRNAQEVPQYKQEVWRYGQKVGMVESLIMLVPRFLFLSSLFMFGLVDLTHGYLWGSLWALCAGAIIFFCWRGRVVAPSTASDYI